jgi:glutamyl-tRNA synthetase
MATQAPHESDGRIVYKGTCRPANIPSKEAERITSSTPAAIRLYVPDMQIDFIDSHYGVQSVNLATHCGDFVLRRKDGAWAYQLAVVVDDALMGITEVVRGRDLLLSASQQLYLYDILSLQVPEFIHFPLLCNKAGQRLSKRDKSLDMGVLRSQYTSEQIIGEIAYYAGQTDRPEPMTSAELLKIFDWDKVPVNDIIVDY